VLAALREDLRDLVPTETSAAAAGAARFARELAAVAPGVLGVLFFGSRMTGAGANAHSAHDLFVVVEDYTRYYAALARAGWSHRRPAFLAALNGWLPPNITSLSLPAEPAGGGRWLAKAAVIRLGRLERETGPRRQDHFCAGRLFQPVEIVFARDDDLRERLLAILASVLAETLFWVRPWLPPEFGPEEYGRALLRVSLAGEIRPEGAGRADQLWEAQRRMMAPRLERLLRALAACGEVRERRPGAYVLTAPAGWGERLGLRLYFAHSKTRATLRWLKHTWTFEDWLTYIVRKVERHAGRPIVLTERERAHPFVFLWPRFFRHLRHKDGRERGQT
jgi:hypothetical protein